MWASRQGRRKSRHATQAGASLGHESLEPRHVLSAVTDVVFLVDESGSTDATKVASWVSEFAGDLETAFASHNISAEYGLIGYAFNGNSARFAHSHIVNDLVSTSDPEALMGTVQQLEEAATRINNLGALEDGWDAIEHVIAEYDFQMIAV